MGKLNTLRILSGLMGMLFIGTNAATSARAPELSFCKENITFTICAPDTVEVSGIYWFSNTGDSSVSTIITYPFPVDSNAEYPYHIVVTRCSTRKPVVFKQFPFGIEWHQSVSARGFDSVLVIYRQKVKKGVGQYIVSTTKQWGKPLQKADFTLCVPRRITMTFWAFQADSLTATQDTILYHSHFKSFLPDGEMEVRWH